MATPLVVVGLPGAGKTTLAALPAGRPRRTVAAAVRSGRVDVVPDRARADMDHYATLFEAPSADELAGADDRPDDPDWTEWSRRRWHTLAQ